MTADETLPAAYRPGDHRAVGAQHPGPLVGDQAALGAEVAGHDLDGVERRLVDRVQRRVRLHGRVGVVLVVGRSRRGGSPRRRRCAAKPLNRSTVAVSASAGTSISAASASRVAAFLTVPCLYQRPGNGWRGDEAGEQVAVAVALVDDHPARHVADAGGLALVDLVHGLDVGQRLVHVPLAGLVDDDRAGQVALGQAEPRARSAAGSSDPTRRRPSGRSRRRRRCRRGCRRRC